MVKVKFISALCLVIILYNFNIQSVRNNGVILIANAKSDSNYYHYKDKYKNKDAKKVYFKIKAFKKGNKQQKNEYLRLKKIYNQYKKLSGDELRKTLTSKDYNDFKLYKKYKGYKKYKKLKKENDHKSSEYNKDKNDAECIPQFIYPLQEPFKKAQGYGETSFSSHYKGGMHNGIDFVAEGSEDIIGVADGVIEATGNMGRYGYGKWIAINHGCGNITLYGQLSTIDVSKGDKIVSGDVIGKQGNTGFSTRPHLHFSVFVDDTFKVVESSSISGVYIPTGVTENPDDFFKN